MFTFAGLMLVLVAAKNDAAITPEDDTKTSAVGDDETIPWDYDNTADMMTVDWIYKSSSTSTPTTIMSKNGTAAATVHNKFNVEHASITDGSITLKSVTLENAGIYLCQVVYTLSSGHAAVTGTVTLSVIKAIFECPGLGNSTAVDSIGECTCAWFGICFAILLVGLFLIGIVAGKCIIKGTKCRKEWVNYYRCECFASTLCGACCNIEGLPKWYQGLWASIIGIPVALGIWVVWKCLGKGNNDTSTNDVGTGSSPKNARTKLLEEKRVSKSPGKADNANKEKHASAKQHQHDDQPPPPAGANPIRERSDSAVSGQNVELQETETSLKRSQLPNIPGHAKNGKGLSSNFKDDDHPLIGIDIPAQKAGALPAITDTPRETKKKTKKKKKDKQEDNQNTETVLNF